MRIDICPRCGEMMVWNGQYYVCKCGSRKMISQEKKVKKEGGE